MCKLAIDCSVYIIRLIVYSAIEVSLNTMWLTVCRYENMLLPFLHVFPSHTEESVSGTADNEGVEPTPEMVSHLLNCQHHTSKYVVNVILMHACSYWYSLNLSSVYS